MTFPGQFNKQIADEGENNTVYADRFYKKNVEEQIYSSADQRLERSSCHMPRASW